MSAREACNMLKAARKRYRVRVRAKNGKVLLVECHTRDHAEKAARRLKRRKCPAKVEVLVG